MIRGILYLSLRHAYYYRLRTTILVTCLSIAIFLPMAVQLLVSGYNQAMVRRAADTPLVVGAKGSPNDLVLSTLYFHGTVADRLNMSHVASISDSRLATPVPLLVQYTTSGVPIVGTTLDYFSFRNLVPRQGRLPTVLGQIVLGSEAARRLNATVGDHLLSDYEKLYDISGSYPLRMKVVGVFAETNTADDSVVFADIKTTWIIDGLCHGHQDATELTDPGMILSAGRNSLVLSGAVAQYNEVTSENLATFHFHGDESDYPVSAIVGVPHDEKSRTILKARYVDSPDAQALVPAEIVGRMMEIVFRIKRYLDAVFLMVLFSTLLFMLLVLWLTARIRQREFQTLLKIGARRGTIVAIQATEVALVLLLSLVLASLLSGSLLWYVSRYQALL